MLDDVGLGRLLEAVDRLGGFSQLLPPIDGLSPEEVFAAADRAERRGHIEGRPVRSAGGQLIMITDVRLTPSGSTYLQQHRREMSHAPVSTSTSCDLDTSTEARRRRRTQFIQAVYDETGASESTFIDGPRLGDRLGLPRSETDNVMQYWEGEGLIHYVTEEGAIGITHRGVVEFEQAQEDPAVATAHFAPNTIIVYGDVHGSQLQAGSSGASQTLTSKAGTSDEMVSDFLAAMRAAILTDPLPDPADNAQVEEMIALVEVERSQPQPNRRLASATTGALRDVALGMAASGGWTAAVALAHQLPH